MFTIEASTCATSGPTASGTAVARLEYKDFISAETVEGVDRGIPGWATEHAGVMGSRSCCACIDWWT
jgi:hypothetical protein